MKQSKKASEKAAAAHTEDQLRQAGIDCLVKAFRGDYSIPSHIVQAAVTVVLSLAA